jgi:tetratricopeptide (TPR) repeat protein
MVALSKLVLSATAGILLTLNPLPEDRTDLPLQVSIPSAVTRFYPRPEEQLATAFARGQEYLLLGRFDESLLELDRAVELSPESAEVRLSRGITEEKLLRWQDAIDDYAKANSILKSRDLFHRDDAVSLSNMANAELGLERWQEALTHFDESIALKKDYYAPTIGRGLTLYQLGREKESYEAFKELTDKFPSFADANAAMAVMEYKAGRLAQADSYFEDAVESDARYIDVDWVLGIRRWTPRLVSDLQTLLKDPRYLPLVKTVMETEAARL